MHTILALLILASGAQAVVDTTTIQHKWIYGYQGWFRKPGNGVNSHWAPSGTPGPGNVEIDFIPDVSGYPTNCLFGTNLDLPNGQKAQLYDNTCDGVVDYHVKLASQAGVDGFAVQRFLSKLEDDTYITVLQQIQAACEKYGVGFFVEYDVSGGDSSVASVASTVIADFNSKIKTFTASSAYFHEGGKPVLMAFGIGFSTFGKTNVSDALNLVNDMKSTGNYFGIGVPQQWANDVRSNTGYASVYKACNFVSPWNVGGYSYAGYKAGYFTTTQGPDVTLTKSMGIGYAPSIWPGTSHYNGGANPSAFDYYPRYNGSFLSLQAQSVTSLDITFIFVAMFDELNEGTQNYPSLKVNQLPTNEKFVGIDNDFSDTNHYLEEGGQLAAALHSKSA